MGNVIWLRALPLGAPVWVLVILMSAGAAVGTYLSMSGDRGQIESSIQGAGGRLYTPSGQQCVIKKEDDSEEYVLDECGEGEYPYPQ